MKISNRILLSLICLIVALVFPMLQIQAADQVVNDKSDSLEFHCTWYLHFKEQDKIYTYGDVSKVVYGRDLRKYSLAYIDSLSGNYRFLIFVTSPAPIEYSGSTSDNKRVEVNGNVVYYLFIDGIESGLDLDNQSLTWSGIPNLTMYSETKDLNSIATGIAEDMARAGYYDYDDSEWATDKFGPDITDARFYDPDCYLVNPVMNYTKGTSALSGTLSTFMGIKLNNDFYSYSSRNMKYTFLWDYVNTSFETDLSSSYMHIDIICNDQVYFFSDFDCLSSGNVEITLQDILSFLKDNGVQPVIESFSIRYTPFYKIELKTYYGRSVRFFVKANSSGILQESQGDDLYGSNSDYFDSDIVSPGDLPVKIPGFTDDESFEFDFSYDSDSMFKNFFISLKSLISYCGQIPVLVNKVFSFLPDAYGNMIVIVLAACFIMRLLGR